MNRLTALLLLPLTATPAPAETLYLRVFQDTWFDEMPTDIEGFPGLAAGGSRHLMVGRVGFNDSTPRRRSLIQFDLSEVPANALITSATVTMYVIKVKNETEETVTLQRITAPWVAGEYDTGSSGRSGGSNPGDATWLHTTSPETWQTPGGDFIGATSATSMVGTNGFYNWTSPELAGDVQSWLSGAAGNHGWIVRGNEDAGFSTVKQFASGQYFEEDYTPLLTLEFVVVPEPSSAALGLVAAAGIWRRRRACNPRGL